MVVVINMNLFEQCNQTTSRVISQLIRDLAVMGTEFYCSNGDGNLINLSNTRREV